MVDDHEICIMDLAVQQRILGFHISHAGVRAYATELAWSSCAKYLAVRLEDARGARHQVVIQIWDVEAGACLSESSWAVSPEQHRDSMVWVPSAPAFLYVSQRGAQVWCYHNILFKALQS